MNEGAIIIIVLYYIIISIIYSILYNYFNTPIIHFCSLWLTGSDPLRQ